MSEMLDYLLCFTLGWLIILDVFVCFNFILSNYVPKCHHALSYFGRTLDKFFLLLKYMRHIFLWNYTHPYVYIIVLLCTNAYCIRTSNRINNNLELYRFAWLIHSVTIQLMSLFAWCSLVPIPCQIVKHVWCTKRLWYILHCLDFKWNASIICVFRTTYAHTHTYLDSHAWRFQLECRMQSFFPTLAGFWNVSFSTKYVWYMIQTCIGRCIFVRSISIAKK